MLYFLIALVVTLYILGVIDAWFCLSAFGIKPSFGFYTRIWGWPIHTAILTVEAICEWLRALR